MSVSDRAVIVRSKEMEIINRRVIGNHPEFHRIEKIRRLRWLVIGGECIKYVGGGNFFVFYFTYYTAESNCFGEYEYNVMVLIKFLNLLKGNKNQNRNYSPELLRCYLSCNISQCTLVDCGHFWCFWEYSFVYFYNHSQTT